ncbi:MAG: hypothetical protein DLM52_02075 [Chthoniobacterales bacterium]|nr:MAG: hypothetical protein DLM52_02075 [Chthoniobacterales bacterium]
MKTGFLLQGTALLLLVVGTTASAQTNERQTNAVKADDQYVEQYVVVTGSNIPRKVKVRRWGTNTPYNVAIYGQHDIKVSGRATTEGALQTLDPSVSVRRH